MFGVQVHSMNHVQCSHARNNRVQGGEKCQKALQANRANFELSEL